MATARQIRQLVKGLDFEEFDASGFFAFRRTHPDGREQHLRIFTWSKPEHADAAGIPRAYLVLVPCIDMKAHPGEDARIRLPLTDWPSREQAVREWVDVQREFHDIIMPILDTSAEQGYRLMNALGKRYDLSRSVTELEQRRRERESASGRQAR